jgi:hypothetical protein
MRGKSTSDSGKWRPLRVANFEKRICAPVVLPYLIALMNLKDYIPARKSFPGGSLLVEAPPTGDLHWLA